MFIQYTLGTNTIKRVHIMLLVSWKFEISAKDKTTMNQLK